MGFFDKFRRKSTPIDSQKLASMLGAWYDTSSGVQITSSNAMQITAVYACVRVLCESIGMLPLNLYERKEKSKTKARKHPLFDLLCHSPNDYMTSQEWLELVVVHQCLRGVHYSYINRISSGVAELLPLNPDSVRPKMSDNWELSYEVTFPNKKKKTLSQDEVLALRTFTSDGFTPMSPIAWNANSIGLAKATESHGASLFKNGAVPIGGFKTDKSLTDEQYNKLQEALEDHQGSSNSFKPLILEGGLDWVRVSITPQDAQYLETRKFQKAEISGIFRVPPHMIGDLENATFSNIEHQGLEFVVHTLMPYLTRIEKRINFQLLTKKERIKYFAKFNVNALLRGDMKARSEFYFKLQQTGSISPNEIRELEDMNPREGGDIYLTPMNMTTNPETSEKESEDANQE